MLDFKRKQSGFTLIELLVVISIIALLSSVVLASLNSARQRAADTVIKQNLAAIRNQAELVFGTSGCYGDGDAGDTTCASTVVSVTGPAAYNSNEQFCTTSSGSVGPAIDREDTIFNNPGVSQLVTAAVKASRDPIGYGALCASNGNAWAIAVAFKSSQLKGWCVDSSGNSLEVSVSGTSGYFVDNDELAKEISSYRCITTQP